LAREQTVDAMKTLAAIHKNPKAPAAARVAAANALLDRGWGKARQTLDFGSDGGAIQHSIEVRFVDAPERDE
jgi:hypothetical protein